MAANSLLWGLPAASTPTPYEAAFVGSPSGTATAGYHYGVQHHQQHQQQHQQQQQQHQQQQIQQQQQQLLHLLQQNPHLLSQLTPQQMACLNDVYFQQQQQQQHQPSLTNFLSSMHYPSATSAPTTPTAASLPNSAASPALPSSPYAASMGYLKSPQLASYHMQLQQQQQQYQQSAALSHPHGLSHQSPPQPHQQQSLLQSPQQHASRSLQQPPPSLNQVPSASAAMDQRYLSTLNASHLTSPSNPPYATNPIGPSLHANSSHPTNSPPLSPSQKTLLAASTSVVQPRVTALGAAPQSQSVYDLQSSAPSFGNVISNPVARKADVVVVYRAPVQLKSSIDFLLGGRDNNESSSGDSLKGSGGVRQPTVYEVDSDSDSESKRIKKYKQGQTNGGATSHLPSGLRATSNGSSKKKTAESKEDSGAIAAAATMTNMSKLSNFTNGTESKSNAKATKGKGKNKDKGKDKEKEKKGKGKGKGVKGVTKKIKKEPNTKNGKIKKGKEKENKKLNKENKKSKKANTKVSSAAPAALSSLLSSAQPHSKVLTPSSQLPATEKGHTAPAEERPLTPLSFLQARISCSAPNVRWGSYSLPHTVILKIFSYLNHISLCAMGQTCKSFQKLADLDSLWQPLCLRELPESKSHHAMIREPSWKAHFKKWYRKKQDKKSSSSSSSNWTANALVSLLDQRPKDEMMDTSPSSTESPITSPKALSSPSMMRLSSVVNTPTS